MHSFLLIDFLNKHLAFKLASYTILLALLVGMLVATWEISRDFNRSTGEIESTAKQLLELTLDAAGEAVYQLDVSQAENLIRGLMQFELFTHVELLDELGQELASSGRSPRDARGVLGFLDIPMQELRYPLPIPGEAGATGMLRATVDVKGGLSPFIDQSVTVASGLVLEALAVAVLIFLVVVLAVTNPIRNLARRLSEIEPGSGERLLLDEGHRIDEIGRLVSSANRYLDTASQYQTELSQSKQVLQDTLNSLLEGVITVDGSGEIFTLNKACQSMFGFERSEAVGLRFITLFDKNTSAKVSGIMESSLENIDRKVSAVGRRVDGSTFPVELSVSTIDHIEGAYSLWTIRDISEQVRLEQERSHLEEKLRHSQKMEAIGTLAGGIAHDFNNLLGGISGFTELAQLQLEKDSPIQSHLANVLASAETATQLVHRILAFSRKQKEDKEPIDLRNIVEDSRAFIEQTIPSTIELVTEIEQESLMVYADRSMMLQVLLNLYTNAASAIGNEPGKITLNLSLAAAPRNSMNQFNVKLPQNSGEGFKFIRISIQDTGPGVPDELIHRIFEPYFTTKDIGSGTGMGLALVHSIVDAHNGFVEFENTDAGASFSVYLPPIKSDVKPSIENLKEEETSSDVNGQENILVVDDNEMLADLFSNALSHYGYNVVVKNDASQAFEEFIASESKYDLVISDQTMPGMTGDRLISKIIARKPDQRVILCTGYSESINEEKALKLGVSRYLMKPVPISSMCQAVREVLDSRA